MRKNNWKNLNNQNVTLEAALHRMSNEMEAVIGWDIIWGTVFIILFSGFITIDRRYIILFSAAISAITAAAGHMLFYLIWKKRSYTKRMLRNTAKYLSVGNPLDYEASVKESLKRQIYVYEDELLVTEDYIIGNAEPNFRYIPVAVPREKITELLFSRQSVPWGRYSIYAGILSCRTDESRVVDLIIGKSSKANEILGILNLRNIEWKWKTK